MLLLEACKLTAFGLRVRTELLKRGISQTQLAKKCSEMTGLYVDGQYIYKILTGQREAPKVKAAIQDILEIKV